MASWDEQPNPEREPSATASLCAVLAVFVLGAALWLHDWKCFAGAFVLALAAVLIDEA